MKRPFSIVRDQWRMHDRSVKVWIFLELVAFQHAIEILVVGLLVQTGPIV
jgi:hypothetical protein